MIPGRCAWRKSTPARVPESTPPVWRGNEPCAALSGSKMDLTAPQLGGQHQGPPGRQGHRLAGGGEAREALQEAEKVVLQAQRAWLHRLGELAVPDDKGRTD